MTEAARLPLHIVTGFLGAGKTSLINRLLRAPELADTLVIVNEWGEIGLDHLLFETIADEVILIASGCLCCTLRGDLIDGLHQILRRRDAGATPPFARVVLETSGLADPAPILHALLADPLLTRRTEVAGVTTLVDAVNGETTLEAHGQARRQVALADRIALTKSDLVSAKSLAPLRASLGEINRAAKILDVAAGEFGTSDFLAHPLALPFQMRASRMSTHGGSVRARAFTTSELIAAASLARFLSHLSAESRPAIAAGEGACGDARMSRFSASHPGRAARPPPAAPAGGVAGRRARDAAGRDLRSHRIRRGRRLVARAHRGSRRRPPRPRRADGQPARPEARRVVLTPRGRRPLARS